MSTENEIEQASPAPEPKEAQAPAPQQGVVVREKTPEWMNTPITLGENFGMTVFGGNQAFALAQRMANALAHSSMVPQEYQLSFQKSDGLWYDNPSAIGNCMIALELATRLQLSPLMVMQNTDMIRGRPSFRAQLLSALVNKSPLFGRLRYEWKEGVSETDDAYGCRAYARDSETGETLYGAWITWKLVRAEGWDGKKDSKWKSMPEQMFMYRAGTFWCRAFAPDLLLGMPTSDELEDVTDDRTALRELNARLEKQVEDEPGRAPAPAAAPASEPAAPRTGSRRRRAADTPAAAPLDQGEPETAAPAGESSGDPVVTDPPAPEAPAPDAAPGNPLDNAAYDVE